MGNKRTQGCYYHEPSLHTGKQLRALEKKAKDRQRRNRVVRLGMVAICIVVGIYSVEEEKEESEGVSEGIRWSAILHLSPFSTSLHSASPGEIEREPKNSWNDFIGRAHAEGKGM